MLVAVVVAVVVVAGLGGGGAAVLPHLISRGSDDRKAGEPKGIDDPRTPPTYASLAGNGGTMGVAVRNALETAGFDCGRAEGSKTAAVVCYASKKEPVPTIQRVAIEISGDDVAQVVANVELDPAWRPLLDDADTRAAAYTTFALVTAAAVPPGERQTVNERLRDAGEDVSATVSTSVGDIDVTIGPVSGEYRLVPQGMSGISTDDGLNYLTAKEVEAAAEEAGLTCERSAEASRCTAGDVTLTLDFPRRDGPEAPQVLTHIEAVGPSGPGGRPAPTLAAVSRAVAGVLGEKYGDGDAAERWIARCFGSQTRQAIIAASELTCSPRLQGSPDLPDTTRFTFSIDRIR